MLESSATRTCAPARSSRGVLEVDERGQVVDYIEKPTLDYSVSTGIYCFHPRVLQYLQKDVRCDLPELVLRLIAAGETVRAHPLVGHWLDIGRPEDYETAMELFK